MKLSNSLVGVYTVWVACAFCEAEPSPRRQLRDEVDARGTDPAGATPGFRCKGLLPSEFYEIEVTPSDDDGSLILHGYAKSDAEGELQLQVPLDGVRAVGPVRVFILYDGEIVFDESLAGLWPGYKIDVTKKNMAEKDRVLSERERYKRFLKRVSKQKPDPKLFEFVGNVDVILDDNPEAEDRVPSTGNINFDSAPTCGAGDMAVMVSADGRMYRERRSSRPDRAHNSSLGGDFDHKQDRSSTAETTVEGLDPAFDDIPTQYMYQETNGTRRRTVIKGSDGRKVRTSSASPWRKVGVALRYSSSLTATCSGAMIGHRSVLTAAHCVSSDGETLKVRRCAPAARGKYYNGNRSPYGNRYVEWYTWPNGWHGQHTAKYDYAILRLTDINWSPGHVHFGYQSTTWMDYKYFNTAGYPGQSSDCKYAPEVTDPDCGGYMYRQYEKVTAVFPSHCYHRFDTQGGQSGSPIYYYKKGKRTIYAINEGSVANSNTAHRIRKGSFGLMCDALDAAKSSYFPNPHC